MKRFWILLLIVLLLAGCGNEDVIPTEPTDPTEPPVPWIQTQGMPWDKEGVLLEIPLTIPGGFHMNAMRDFDGDLLVWSVDTHLEDTTQLELCVVDLDTGTVIAQREIDFKEYVTPQVLGDALYLCDRTAGRIMQLNKELADVKVWNTESGGEGGNWYMGSGEKLYMMDMDSNFSVRDLTTGQVTSVLEGDPEVSWITVSEQMCFVEYYRADTGASDTLVVDLVTGEAHEPPTDEEYDSVQYVNGTWLCNEYVEGYSYHLTVNGGETMYIPQRDGYLTLLEEGHLADNSGDNTSLALYDLNGKLISACQVYASGAGFATNEFIWSEELGGYFLPVRSYDESTRLLFWDISKTIEGDDLVMSPLPEPDQVQAQLNQRAKELGEKYGLTILVGEEADTQFDEFTATQIADYEQVDQALNVLDEALSVYPEGFLRQLRYSNIHGIKIHLICDLQADGSGRFGGGYAAFAQPQWDHYMIVMDIDVSDESTYHHEFSHVIDSFLEWDAGQREDALFSEDGWAAFNPDWFGGYSYDYSEEHPLYDYKHFVDSYSTVKPTEDRARVMEYAMADYGQWTFEDADPLLGKLDYYCRCIRDAFDTTGWPETVLWEQYLGVG